MACEPTEELFINEPEGEELTKPATRAAAERITPSSTTQPPPQQQQPPQQQKKGR